MADAQDSREQEVAARTRSSTARQEMQREANLEHLRSGKVIRAPYGASQHAPIDERDIAAVAVEALLTDRRLGEKVPLTTSPRSQASR
jgi:hypothetical protein